MRNMKHFHLETKTMTRSPEEHGSVAANLTMNASADYIHRNNLTVTDYKVAADVIRDFCKEALETGMGQIAEATFQASMRMAGIEAAKKLVEDGIAV